MSSEEYTLKKQIKNEIFLANKNNPENRKIFLRSISEKIQREFGIDEKYAENFYRDINDINTLKLIKTFIRKIKRNSRKGK